MSTDDYPDPLAAARAVQQFELGQHQYTFDKLIEYCHCVMSSAKITPDLLLELIREQLDLD